MLIPILTPSFFNSEPCRAELEQFLEREKELGRNDLVLPLYYIDHPAFSDEVQREARVEKTLKAARRSNPRPERHPEGSLTWGILER